jgi:hypothetical protein
MLVCICHPSHLFNWLFPTVSIKISVYFHGLHYCLQMAIEEQVWRTRPDRDEHGHEFLPMYGTLTKAGTDAGIFFTHQVSKTKCVSVFSPADQPIYHHTLVQKEYFWKVLEIGIMLNIAGDSDFS